MPREAKIYQHPKLSSGFPLFSPAKSKAYLLSCDSIRVSDAWSFLNYTIKLSKHKTTGQPLTAAQQKYLLDLLAQAEYFFETAQTAPIKSQPLLYYYSFMNLVKKEQKLFLPHNKLKFFVITFSPIVQIL